MIEIKFLKGNIFQSDASALVCPVNSFGIMGAGLALEFDKKFDNTAYKDVCLKGQMGPGSVYIKPSKFSDEQHIIYAATKFHWKENSEEEYVEHCLINLLRSVLYFNNISQSIYKIKSVAMPFLGCGCGKINPSKFKEIITIFVAASKRKLAKHRQDILFEIWEL